MEVCGAKQTSGQGTCDRAPHQFGTHFDSSLHAHWAGVEAPSIRSASTSRSRVAVAAQALSRPPRTGPPTTVPPAAAQRWISTDQEWLACAKQALHRVATLMPQFTTGDVWPLLDAPVEKRMMSLVVTHGVRLGWMHETGARREKGVYRTRDGVEFPLNKLVPVFTSLVYQEGIELS
jgi:hypothetical protein